MFDEDRCKELCELVHSTVKDVTWIGTTVSMDRRSIDIQLRFGSQAVVIPVMIEDIMENRLSCKGFLALIVPPLENVLKLHAEKETVDVK